MSCVLLFCFKTLLLSLCSCLRFCFLLLLSHLLGLPLLLSLLLGLLLLIRLLLGLLLLLRLLLSLFSSSLVGSSFAVSLSLPLGLYFMLSLGLVGSSLPVSLCLAFCFLSLALSCCLI